jgi:hypothetical protein
MNASKFTRGVHVKKTHPIKAARGGRFWALRGAPACRGHGAEIRLPKNSDAAEWLAIQNNFAVHSSLLEQQRLHRHHTTPISLPPKLTPGFQKKKEKRINSQNAGILAQIVASRWGHDLC